MEEMDNVEKNQIINIFKNSGTFSFPINGRKSNLFQSSNLTQNETFHTLTGNNFQLRRYKNLKIEISEKNSNFWKLWPISI